MRLRKATAAVLRAPRPPRLPRVRAPRLHQPSLHVTAMVAAATVVTALAAASPALQGNFVGAHTPSGPAAVVQDEPQAAAQVQGQVAAAGTPTYVTHVTPPPHTVIAQGPGDIATVLYDPSGSDELASPLASDGIPVTALEAYQDAANAINATEPGCHLPWPLLAGIGRVESDHGRFGGAVLRSDGTSTKKIIGPPLNGSGTEVITDTDDGRLDGDPIFDRAVGPMQFIPSTWATYGTDGNGDGIADPFNIFDAAAAAAHYLCVAGGDLSTTAGQTRAVLSYNHSTAYLDEVLALEHTYASNDPGLIVPAAPAQIPPVPTQLPGGAPVPPPVNPGPPLSGGKPTHPKPTPTGTETPRPGGSSTTTTGPGPSSTTPASPGGSPTTSAPAPGGGSAQPSQDPTPDPTPDPSSSSSQPSDPSSSDSSSSAPDDGSSSPTDSSVPTDSNGAGTGIDAAGAASCDPQATASPSDSPSSPSGAGGADVDPAADSAAADGASPAAADGPKGPSSTASATCS